MPRKKRIKIPKPRNAFVAVIRLRPSGAHSSSRKVERKSAKLLLKDGRWADQSSPARRIALIGPDLIT